MPTALRISHETEKMLANSAASQVPALRTGSELQAKDTAHTHFAGPTQTPINPLKGTHENLRVLGVGWNPEKDSGVLGDSQFQ